MIRFLVLAALAFCLSEAAPSGYRDVSPHNGREADVNRANALRQLKVNQVAQHVGSGTGTARIDGVAGTPLGRTGRDRFSNRYAHGYAQNYGHGYSHDFAHDFSHGHVNDYAHAFDHVYPHGHVDYPYSYHGHGRFGAYGAYNYEDEVNRINANRQLQVNRVAERIGSGTGTANYDGVPGTDFGVTGRDHYSYNNVHGYHGYGPSYTHH